MINHTFDTITRRASAMTLGGADAALATAASPDVSVAKKSVGKTCKKKEKQRCSSDAAACKAQVPAACSGDAECIAEASLCCDTCGANEFLICLVAASATSVTSAAFG